jgi:hypothetical protein
MRSVSCPAAAKCDVHHAGRGQRRRERILLGTPAREDAARRRLSGHLASLTTVWVVRTGGAEEEIRPDRSETFPDDDTEFDLGGRLQTVSRHNRPIGH